MTSFSCKTELISGPDALDWLNTCSAKKVLLVTDRFFTASGVAQRIGSRIAGATVEIFDEVVADPPVEVAAKGVARFRQLQPDLLIALGGGSPMDTAKAILYLSDSPVKFVAIPTTSGSGSEVTDFSILTRDGVKFPLIDPVLCPGTALLVPELVEQLPAALAAETGMDAVSHCVEAVAAAGASPLSDALAQAAFRTLCQSLPRSCRGDQAARAAVHTAASMAGIAFNNAGLGVCHALAHGLGGAFHVAHGRLCGILLPHVIDFNAPACAGAYCALAQTAGLTSAKAPAAIRSLTAQVRRLRSAVGLPGSLSEAGISAEALESRMEALISAALDDRCLSGNPRPAGRAELAAILRQAVNP